MLNGFRWSEAKDLPESIAWLPDQHGIPYSHEFFHAFIDKLAEWLRGD